MEKIIKHVPEGLHGFFASLYDKEIARVILPDFYRLIAEEVAIAIESGRILDVGTGPAYLSIEIVKAAPNIHVVGLDVSNRMVEIARKNVRGTYVAGQIDLVRGDGNSLPFEDGVYDMVISTGVLFTCKNPVRVLNECHRVLKCGGEAWIYDFRRDIREEEIKRGKEELRKRGLSRLGQLMTVFAIRIAYTINEFSKVVDETKFESYDIKPYGIGNIGNVGMKARLKRCSD